MKKSLKKSGLQVAQKGNGATFIKLIELERWVRTLLWSLNLSHLSNSCHKFINSIKLLWRMNGAVSLVKYLKECNRITMTWCTGNFCNESIGIPIGLRNGLPKIIPFQLRSLMESGDKKVIRLVLTILSLYRVIGMVSTLKLSTITDPFKGISAVVSNIEMITIRKKVISTFGDTLNIRDLSKRFKLSNITTAGCNFKVSTLSAPFDALALKESIVHDNFKRLCELCGFSSYYEDFQKEYDLVSNNSESINRENLVIGRLSTKVEAAGKVRVFAITDWWTQNLLFPLHESINNLLKRIPQDGTFDQIKPLNLLTSKVGKSYMVSYDLSAATDRLPLDFQIDVLSQFLGIEFARNWADLLRNRDWLLKKDHEGKELNLLIRYSVGQPMGAYSSFAMLALSHHFIVQLAAQRADHKGWFEDYALLGDDIVIANRLVASHYLYIMRDYFGVEINLSKSLESDNGVSEFAKRLNTPDGQLTAIGPKVLLQVIRNVNYLPALFIDLMNKGIEFDFNAITSMFSNPLSEINRIRGQAWTQIYWCLISPFGYIPSDTLLPILSGHKELSRKEVNSFLIGFVHFVIKSHKKLLDSNFLNAQRSLNNLRKLLKEERRGIDPSILSDLPSTAFILSLYKRKLDDAQMAGYHSDFENEVEDLLDRKSFDEIFKKVPWIISKITPKISSEKDLLQDNLEKLVEAGKTAFQLSTYVGKFFQIPKPKPIVKMRKRIQPKVVKQRS